MLSYLNTFFRVPLSWPSSAYLSQTSQRKETPTILPLVKDQVFPVLFSSFTLLLSLWFLHSVLQNLLWLSAIKWVDYTIFFLIAFWIFVSQSLLLQCLLLTPAPRGHFAFRFVISLLHWNSSRKPSRDRCNLLLYSSL